MNRAPVFCPFCAENDEQRLAFGEPPDGEHASCFNHPRPASPNGHAAASDPAQRPAYGTLYAADGRLASAVRRGNPATDEVPTAAISLRTCAQMRRAPAVDWLVEGWLPSGCLATLVGQSGSGKTFVALDLSLSIAHGIDWCGQPTKRGSTVYVAAEGGAGLATRVDSWCKHHNHGADLADARFYPDAIIPTDERVRAALLAALRPLPALRLVVLDTLARCIGGDENDTRDMSSFVAALDSIRRDTGAAVLVVHHFGWAAERQRGSSALRAAVDVELSVSRDEQLGTITVSCSKLREGAPCAPLRFDLVPVVGAASCVPVLTSQVAGLGALLPEQHRAALRAVAAAGAAGARFTDIQRGSGVERKPTLAAILNGLAGTGYLQADGIPGTRDRRYALTRKGREALA